jgi:hypothetical protein
MFKGSTGQGRAPVFQDNLEEFQCAQCYDIEINLEAKGYNIPEQYLGSHLRCILFLAFS